jgi:hypothetical protein
MSFYFRQSSGTNSYSVNADDERGTGAGPEADDTLRPGKYKVGRVVKSRLRTQRRFTRIIGLACGQRRGGHPQAVQFHRNVDVTTTGAFRTDRHIQLQITTKHAK